MESACREGGGPVASPVFGAYFEGRAVRTAVGVALVTVCLGLAGCSLFGKKQAAHKSNPKPFLGSEAPAKTDTAAMPHDSGPLPGANGVLAGRVIVEATDRPIRASILLKNLDRENAKGADLDLSTNEDGYFYFPKLNAGENYELIARAKDNNGDLISYRLYVKPPKPTLLIRLDKRWTTASTPPPPDMPQLRDKPATAGAESPKEHKPAVSIDPPIKMEDPGSPSGAASGTRQPEAPVRGANPANIAEGRGFHRIAPPSETISIPPPPPPPQPPQWESMPDPRQPARSVPSPSGSVRMPNLPTPVPSCLLLGNRLDNFALYDLDGKVWEYRNRRGRLTLLDFWSLSCLHCINDIHHLVELQRDYGKYGLEIVSIVCETGNVEEQRQNVRRIRLRHGINYRTLLSGGDSCPVMGQFQVVRFPSLVLIDADGTILWRSDPKGMDRYAHYVLRKLINDRLVAQQSQP